MLGTATLGDVTKQSDAHVSVESHQCDGSTHGEIWMCGFGTSAAANGTAINNVIFQNSEQFTEISKGSFTYLHGGR